jgi:Family of unknown function (DUF6492)
VNSRQVSGSRVTKEQLSFVLPVAVGKGTSPVDSKEIYWRQSFDRWVETRLRILLMSFLKHFKQDDLLEFIIVCPACEQSAVSAVVNTLTSDTRYRILSEDEVLLDAKAVVNIPGWFKQQIIKLAVSRLVECDYYVTLDSDIVCVKPTAYRDLIVDGRALTNVETPSDYERIYTDQFALKETQRKVARYRAAAKVIGYRRPAFLEYRFFGETPVILHTASVIALTEYLGDRYHRPWIQTLAASRTWTEYGLYFQFLEMTQRLDSICVLGDCNCALDLENSVWHESQNYRNARVYDAAFFRALRCAPDKGFFVALQSWLPPQAWLPTGCQSPGDFYGEVENWLSIC